MMINNGIKRWSSAVITALALISLGCTNSSNRTSDDSDPTGLRANLQIDLPLSGDTATASGALYSGRNFLPLVAGDVLVVSSQMEESILRTRDGEEDITYSGEVFVDTTAESVTFTVEHRPIEARAERWYPVEELLVDPGPSDLVGLSVAVDFPEEIRITAPVNEASFTALTNAIQVQWTAASDDTDKVRVVSNYNCTAANGDIAVGSYTSESLDDTGSHDTDIDTLVNVGVFNADAFLNQLTTLAQEVSYLLTLNVVDTLFGAPPTVSAGSADNPFFSLANPESCTIRLVVIRDKLGVLPDDFSGGQVTASRSDSISIRYDLVP